MRRAGSLACRLRAEAQEAMDGADAAQAEQEARAAEAAAATQQAAQVPLPLALSFWCCRLVCQ